MYEYSEAFTNSRRLPNNRPQHVQQRWKQTISKLPSPNPIGQREHLPFGTSLSLTNTNLAMLPVLSIHIPSGTCTTEQYTCFSHCSSTSVRRNNLNDRCTQARPPKLGTYDIKLHFYTLNTNYCRSNNSAHSLASNVT